MREVLLAGAEKVSVNSAAVRNPDIITGGASLFGSQCIVLGMDVARDPACRPATGGHRRRKDARRTWTRCMGQEAEELGAGEIVLNSIDADGTQDGYELPLTALISRGVGVPVVASGGAGTPEHLLAVFGTRRGCRPGRLHGALRRLDRSADQGYLGRNGMPVRVT